MTTSSLEANKELVKGYFEACNEQDAEWLAENFTDPMVYCGDERSIEDMIETETGFWKSFPDLRRTVIEIFAEGDRVAVRERIVGTHEGEIAGIEATGKEVEATGSHVFGIEDGKIAERWYDWDALGFWEQLGAVERKFPQS